MRALVHLCVAALACAATRVDAARTEDLKQLSMEELLDVQITSVSKRSERLQDAPASVYVISAEDIRRNGVTTLPEALRLAPGLQVARVDSVQYAISARGFNNAIGNKLLVLVDGRTVYTPLFSGVFWDDQALPLQDVERIEVITGPGATLWGANAVNGVINVITRDAADTQGTLLAADAGSDERGLFLRHGLMFGGGASLRVYGTYRDWDASNLANGAAAQDEWHRAQAGFRADWSMEGDAFTLQGDVRDGASQSRSAAGARFERIETSGANLLGRWTRTLEGGSSLRLQAYYDHSERHDVLLFEPRSDLADLELQHAFDTGRHRVIWGGGYRHASDDAGPGMVIAFIPQRRDLQWGNVFAQDEIALLPSLRLTLGMKFERNTYTGWENLPSLRLAFEPSPRQLLWLGASRAVRAPARIDREIYFPATPPFLIAGGPQFESEVANVFEVGYRGQLAPSVTLSATAFLHDWSGLRSGTSVPVVLQNDLEGEVRGLEAWAVWQPWSPWKLQAGLTWLHEDVHPMAGREGALGANDANLRNDPDHQWSLRSSLDLARQVTFDVTLRGVASLPHPVVPAYEDLDATLTWQPHDQLRLALSARNLLHSQHAEFGNPATRAENGRSLHGGLAWQF